MNINDINEILKLTAEVYGEDSCAFAAVCDFLGDNTLLKEKFKDYEGSRNMPPAESIVLSMNEETETKQTKR